MVANIEPRTWVVLTAFWHWLLGHVRRERPAEDCSQNDHPDYAGNEIDGPERDAREWAQALHDWALMLRPDTERPFGVQVSDTRPEVLRDLAEETSYPPGEPLKVLLVRELFSHVRRDPALRYDSYLNDHYAITVRAPRGDLIGLLDLELAVAYGPDFRRLEASGWEVGVCSAALTGGTPYRSPTGAARTSALGMRLDLAQPGKVLPPDL